MIGKTFDDFTILEKIGEGGMGKVFLGIQNSLEREVAIKVITVDKFFDSSEKVDRFIREARITASIQHPNIVNVYKVGKCENFFYIAMEYIDGDSLDLELEKKTLSEKAVWEITLQVCKGLQSALQDGVIHRDIKPGNILLLQGNIAKLTDFGLSKKITDQDKLTQEGIILGSPAYMSPEQTSGQLINFHSDIYSLGATVYHLLTGKALFTGKNILDILYKHRFETPVTPSQIVPSLQKESNRILAKMLYKNPQERYLTYGDLLADISSFLDGESLPFASSYDEETVYLYDPGVQKKEGFTEKISQKFSSLFTSPKKPSSQSLLWISGSKPDLNLLKDAGFTIHLAATFAELTSCLKFQNSVVVLDGKFLGANTVDFLQFLKKDFPETPIAILAENIPEKISSEEKKLFINPENMPASLIKYLENPFFAKGINLQFIFRFAGTRKWTTRLWIHGEDENAGTISFRQGKITKAHRGDLEGESAIKWFLEKGDSWQSSKKMFKSSMNLKREFSPSSSREIPLENSTLENSILEKTVLERTPEPSNEVLKLKSTNSSKETQIYNQESVKEKKNYTEDDSKMTQPYLQENTKGTKVSPGLAEVLAEIEEDKRQKEESQKIESEREKTREIEEKEDLFDLYMDEALDALLQKNYVVAWEYFSKAQKIRPEDSRLKVNLERLEKMGYAK